MTIRTGNEIARDAVKNNNLQTGGLQRRRARAKISDFADRVQELLDAHAKGRGPYADPPLISINWGRRYAKLVRTDNNQKFVYGFVDIATGDILKAASWSGPAKHTRGNINNPDKGMGACTPWGITYLR